MKILKVSEAVRNFRRVLSEVEGEKEDVVFVRNGRWIARLVPEPREQNALEVLSDLEAVLDEETGENLARAVNTARKLKGATLKGLRNPFEAFGSIRSKAHKRVVRQK